jgi:hypothetical protein
VSLCAVALLYGVMTNSKVGSLPSGYTHARLLSIALTSEYTHTRTYIHTYIHT